MSDKISLVNPIITKQKLPTPVNSATVKTLFNISSFLFISLLINGFYLASTDLIEQIFTFNIQNNQYQYMFALHLLLGVLFVFIVPVYIFGHIKCVQLHTNKIATIEGKKLASILIVIIISGILLVRGVSSFEIDHNLIRSALYFFHVALPLLTIFLYLKHRQSGNGKIFFLNKITLISFVLFFVMPLFTQIGTEKEFEKIKTYSPSFFKTANTDWKADELIQDKYCAECHATSHHRWSQSAHRNSSFNNPFYRFAVNNFREKLEKETGNVTNSRFCAGCHDPVPLLTGEFDQLDFSLRNNKTASAGITCIACHAITSIDSVKGNADFTLNKPQHYPFADSKSPVLSWLSKVMIKSNPDFHKRTFLKPLHKKPEFCGACHKVSIPPEINNYRWLRGQNHYDSFLSSGVSGHSVISFYYPQKAIKNCSQCHMPFIESDEFASKVNLVTGTKQVHDHLFPAANTALSHSDKNLKFDIIEPHQKMLKKSARINIIGFRKEGKSNGLFIGPIGNQNIKLRAGNTYLIEVVIRTDKVGHDFTQGTADSNQVWISLNIESNGKILGRSGNINTETGKLNKNSHLINTYLVDKIGNKIDRRNVESIHTTLYNHQIPPGSADVIHYRFTMPKKARAPLIITAKLHYRKFDTNYMKLSLGDNFSSNTLPITTISTDEVMISLSNKSESIEMSHDWMALNDYGIGLLRKPRKIQFLQAEDVFLRVAKLGQDEGYLNLVRLYYQQGQLEKAKNTLAKINLTQIDNPWTVAWYKALIFRDNGLLDNAIALFQKLLETDWPDAKTRGFDFAKSTQLLNIYAESRMMRSTFNEQKITSDDSDLFKAKILYQKSLKIDPENSIAHFGLYKIFVKQNNLTQAKYHKQQHQTYKEDDSANNSAIRLARSKSDYADQMANPIVIYDLNLENDSQ